MFESVLLKLRDEEIRTVLFILISGTAVLISFLWGKDLPADPAWIAIILCGVPIIIEAVIGLVTRFDIRADVLVSIALVASVLIGETFAAAEIAVIMQIGSYLEERTVAKARAGIEKLINLTPPVARIVQNGEEKIISADTVQVGDVLRVLPGETIVSDGVILSGCTSIDQSVMTGESLPVDKQPDDEVFSGTVNQFGSFDMRATKVGKDSSLARMIRLIESADAGKAQIVRAADRWATWIVAAALTVAVLTYLVTGDILRSVTVLVVFCPCAMVLATPTAIMAGIGNATKFGILIREGDALERLSMVQYMVFDKTGTLTYGKPEVTKVHSISPDISGDELLSLAASAEIRSEHPLGKSIVRRYTEQHGTAPPQPGTFVMLPGRGVAAECGAVMVLVGNPELFAEHDVFLPPELVSAAEACVRNGSTIMYVAANSRPAGFIALADQMREDAPSVVNAVRAMGICPVLLTGDNQAAAARIAAAAGISDVHAECLPSGKLEMIDRYQEDGIRAAMIGDGVNDAPALKRAFAGVAMGGIGSDIAVDAADVVLVRDDLRYIPHLFDLAKKVMQTIRINLALALLLNFAAIVLAVTGIIGPILGALIHNVGSVLVIINSALLLGWERTER
ncbi:MAG: cation-translocating P-type ATPase [Methanocorpusculum sp.]|nr:cation-translocating P-type ATPase [Methanocorpusculum sp.]MDE2522299.1 cation-translocating P-type ATPase [Methanocorpusculum sp.]MDE2525108.1 cation-translocating P-type ATPase [Methanocorpusculum sp.]